MTTVNLTPVPSSSDAEAAEFVAGFRRVETEISALAEPELVPVNLDVASAVATVLGALPEIRMFRGEVSELPGFDLVRFDRLRDYALALGHAHALYRAGSGPPDAVSELAEEVASIRDVLQTDAAALARRRILDPGQVTRLRRGNGFRDIASEVADLVGLFREHWARVIGRSALDVSELEYASQLAQELVTAVSLRERSPVVEGAVASLRQRAFTLLVVAYDEARRAIAYLRWHQRDAGDIAPPLCATRAPCPAIDDSPTIPDFTVGTPTCR
jgi:hypothetical protein